MGDGQASGPIRASGTNMEVPGCPRQIMRLWHVVRLRLAVSVLARSPWLPVLNPFEHYI